MKFVANSSCEWDYVHDDAIIYNFTIYLFLILFVTIFSLPWSPVQWAGEESGFQIHQDPDGDQHRLLALWVAGEYVAVHTGRTCVS